MCMEYDNDKKLLKGLSDNILNDEQHFQEWQLKRVLMNWNGRSVGLWK